MNRAPLLRHLKNAWLRSIRGAYQNREINSERGLQVHVCAALFEQFASFGHQRNILVEPNLRLEETGSSVFPDLVICSSRTIIGVVELKYQPRTTPTPDKDIGTLQQLAKLKGGLTLSNDRFRGPSSRSPVYSLSPTAILCWAGVYCRSEPLDLHDGIGKPLLGRFFQLHAVTSHDKPAELFFGKQNGSLRRLEDIS